MNPMDVVRETAELIGWENLQNELGVSRQCIWNWKSGNRKSPSSQIIVQCLAIKAAHEKKQEKQGQQCFPIEGEFR